MAKVHVKLNGYLLFYLRRGEREIDIEAKDTSEILQQLGIKPGEWDLFALNGKIIPDPRKRKIKLSTDDQIEIFPIVGGG
jgi:thiamine biosynthesis protein ThiS